MACTGTNTIAPSVPAAATESAARALARAAQRYTAIVAPIDAAIDRFESESGALPGGASVDDFVAIARPFTNTIAEVDNELRQVRWPPIALHDINAELAADRSLRSDLTRTTDVTLILAVWRHQIISAARKASDTKGAVKGDLGVAPASAG